jgi:hypothetical protein
MVGPKQSGSERPRRAFGGSTQSGEQTHATELTARYRLRWPDTLGFAAGALLAARWGGPLATVLIGTAVLIGLASGAWRHGWRPPGAPALPSPTRAMLIFGVPTTVVAAGYLALGKEGAALAALKAGILLALGW